MSLVLVACLGAIMLAMEALAVVAAVGATGGVMVAAALGLHGLATALCAGLARWRRPDLSPVEHDLVLLAAVFVPVFGPLLAWCMPRPRGVADAVNAHEMFERYEGLARPLDPEFERSLFTGDSDRDLARELDVESYHEVLKRGTVAQKRGALGRLAASKEPQHLALLRRSLLDPSHEVQLYAYAELARLGEPYEEELRAKDLAYRAQPADPGAVFALASAHFALARSGLYEPDLAQHHLRSAARLLKIARELGADVADVGRVEALVLSELCDYEGALERLGELVRGESETELHRMRAEVAYACRDLDLARASAATLIELGEPLPDWLAAIAPRPRPSEASAPVPAETGGAP